MSLSPSYLHLELNLFPSQNKSSPFIQVFIVVVVVVVVVIFITIIVLVVDFGFFFVFYSSFLYLYCMSESKNQAKRFFFIHLHRQSRVIICTIKTNSYTRTGEQCCNIYVWRHIGGKKKYLFFVRPRDCFVCFFCVLWIFFCFVKCKTF